MNEVWKDVVGLEEYFSISNKGNLVRKAIYNNNWRNTKTKVYVNRPIKATNDRGYLKINLSINGKRKIKYIHRLVAEAFISNPNNFKEINHIDSNPSNNNVENLEWCDRKYNINYMVKHQEQIKEKNERRLEVLENIYYGIELGYIKNLKHIQELIKDTL